MNYIKRQFGDEKMVFKVYEFYESCYCQKVYKGMIDKYFFQVINVDGVC